LAKKPPVRGMPISESIKMVRVAARTGERASEAGVVVDVDVALPSARKNGLTTAKAPTFMAA